MTSLSKMARNPDVNAHASAKSFRCTAEFIIPGCLSTVKLMTLISDQLIADGLVCLKLVLACGAIKLSRGVAIRL
jgi:hypothetical protein